MEETMKKRCPYCVNWDVNVCLCGGSKENCNYIPLNRSVSRRAIFFPICNHAINSVRATNQFCLFTDGDEILSWLEVNEPAATWEAGSMSEFIADFDPDLQSSCQELHKIKEKEAWEKEEIENGNGFTVIGFIMDIIGDIAECLDVKSWFAIKLFLEGVNDYQTESHVSA